MPAIRLLHSCAAAALIGMIALPGAALAGRGGDRGGPRHDHQHDGHPGHGQKQEHKEGHGPQQRAAHHIAGTLLAMNSTSAPATLTVQVGAGTTVTVTIATTTTVVRRFGGSSNLEEMTVGDRVSATGVFEQGDGSTFDATRVLDLSIQKAYSRVAGRVETVAGGIASIKVTGGRVKHSPYVRGELLRVSFAPACVVMNGTTTATVADVQPGVNVVVMGVYDRLSHTLRVDRVHIVAAHGHNGQDDRSEATSTPTTTGSEPTDQPTTEPTAEPTDQPTIEPTADADS